MSARASLLIGVLAASGAARVDEPRVVSERGALWLRGLPDVLSERTVAAHLDTGLTTSFVFTVDAGRVDGRAIKGQAGVRIRYDLWDERYVAAREDARSESPLTTTLKREALGAWWRALAFLVNPATPSLRAPPLRARVELLVLPFSQAEQRDAQDWLLRSFRSPETPPRLRQPRADGVLPPAEAPGAREPIRELHGAMLAASIGQRSLLTFSWTVAIAREEPAGQVSK